ncbi:hypothetical protein D3C80_1886490 [compost metagenome]
MVQEGLSRCSSRSSTTKPGFSAAASATMASRCSLEQKGLARWGGIWFGSRRTSARPRASRASMAGLR